MSGNVGISPNNKIHLNSNNTVIDDSLKLKASQVTYVNGSTTTTVQAALDGHKQNINSLQDQIDNIGESLSGTIVTNYNLLTNKPQINGVELVGNKSLADLGITGTGSSSADQISYNGGTVKDALDDLQELITIQDIDAICSA